MCVAFLSSFSSRNTFWGDSNLIVSASAVTHVPFTSRSTAVVWCCHLKHSRSLRPMSQRMRLGLTRPSAYGRFMPTQNKLVCTHLTFFNCFGDLVARVSPFTQSSSYFAQCIRLLSPLDDRERHYGGRYTDLQVATVRPSSEQKKLPVGWSLAMNCPWQSYYPQLFCINLPFSRRCAMLFRLLLNARACR